MLTIGSLMVAFFCSYLLQIGLEQEKHLKLNSFTQLKLKQEIQVSCIIIHLPNSDPNHISTLQTPGVLIYLTYEFGGKMGSAATASAAATASDATTAVAASKLIPCSFAIFSISASNFANDSASAFANASIA